MTPEWAPDGVTSLARPLDLPRGVDATARLHQAELGGDQSPLSASLARTVERRLHLRARDGQATTVTSAQHEGHSIHPVARTPVAGDLGLTVRPTVHLDHHEVEPVAVAPARLLVELPALSTDNGWTGQGCVTGSHDAPAPRMDGNDSVTVGILQMLLAHVIWFAMRTGRTLLDAALVTSGEGCWPLTGDGLAIARTLPTSFVLSPGSSVDRRVWRGPPSGNHDPGSVQGTPLTALSRSSLPRRCVPSPTGNTALSLGKRWSRSVAERLHRFAELGAADYEDSARGPRRLGSADPGPSHRRSFGAVVRGRHRCGQRPHRLRSARGAQGR